jgi:hypothetical protein
VSSLDFVLPASSDLSLGLPYRTRTRILQENQSRYLKEKNKSFQLVGTETTLPLPLIQVPKRKPSRSLEENNMSF